MEALGLGTAKVRPTTELKEGCGRGEVGAGDQDAE